METGKRYLSVKEVAEQLSLSQVTVRKLVHMKQLPAVRTGPTLRTLRIAQEDLEAYLKAHATTGPAPSTEEEAHS